MHLIPLEWEFPVYRGFHDGKSNIQDVQGITHENVVQKFFPEIAYGSLSSHKISNLDAFTLCTLT